MSDRIECRYHGRDFPEGEIAWLRKLIAGPPAANRHGLSKEFCRRIGWLKPDGGLKDMMARVTMLAMHDDGLIVLSPPKWKQNRPGPIVFGQDTEPPLFPPPTTLDEGQAAGDPHRRRRYAAGEALERVRRPPPLSRLQDLRRRADALRRPRPQRLAARHDRLQHRRMGARSTGPLHRMDSDPAQEEPAARHRRPPVPNPASGSASPTSDPTSSHASLEVPAIAGGPFASAAPPPAAADGLHGLAERLRPRTSITARRIPAQVCISKVIHGSSASLYKTL